MPGKRTKERIGAAYRAAGEAVAAWRFHIGIKNVAIVQDAGSPIRALVTYRRDMRVTDALAEGAMTSAQRHVIENRIVTFYAGGIAERLYRGPQAYRGAEADRESQRDWANKICASTEEADAYLNWLWTRTTNLVTASWPQIQAVIHALLEQHTLASWHVDRMVRASLRTAKDVPSPDQIDQPDA